MVDLPDETLMAYADGALENSERLRVEAILAANPDQQRRLEPYIVTRAALQSLMSEALTSTVPDRLVATVMTAPIGNGVAGQRPTPRAESFFTRLRTALFPELPAFAGSMALAATVAAIAGLGFASARLMQATQPGSQNVAVNGGEAIARGSLQAALDATPSMQELQQGTVRVRPVQTFRDVAGHFCRQYSLKREGGDEIAGFACRKSDGNWSIAYHAPSSLAGGPPAAHAGGAQPDEGQFSPASGEDQSTETAVEQAIGKVKVPDGLIEKGDEARLISQGWPQN